MYRSGAWKYEYTTELGDEAYVNGIYNSDRAKFERDAIDEIESIPERERRERKYAEEQRIERMTRAQIKRARNRVVLALIFLLTLAIGIPLIF